MVASWDDTFESARVDKLVNVRRAGLLRVHALTQLKMVAHDYFSKVSPKPHAGDSDEKVENPG